MAKPTKKNQAEKQTQAILDILAAIDFPLGAETEFQTDLRQGRVAHIFLAVAKLKPNQSLSKLVFDGDGQNHAPRSRDIIDFINTHYGETLSRGSYDDIRRKNLDFLVAAKVVVKAANRPGAATNDGTRGYAVSRQAAELIAQYQTDQWPAAVAQWKKKQGALNKQLSRPRPTKKVVVKLPAGETIDLSLGVHNEIQKSIIEEFLPRFLNKPELLYLGDSSKKILICEDTRLAELGFKKLDHDLLPDVIAYDLDRDWLYFIEAVHSSNPINRLRHLKLEEMSSNCQAGVVYVSAFLNRENLRKWIVELSWETEVWLTTEPEHMIHLNGDRFQGPH
ncbi:MAG: BsuBI/PstI family type II restriction endonuclease [Akkermansiaceae bacterium]